MPITHNLCYVHCGDSENTFKTLVILRKAIHTSLADNYFCFS